MPSEEVSQSRSRYYREQYFTLFEVIFYHLRALATVSTSRKQFQRLARERIREAKALYSAGCYDGAYYVAGYAVEFAIKAVACKAFQRHTMPDMGFVRDLRNHDLNALLGHAGLRPKLAAKEASDPQFKAKWAVICKWSAGSRYTKNSKLNARDLIRSIDGTPSSFMEWVESIW